MSEAKFTFTLMQAKDIKPGHYVHAGDAGHGYMPNWGEVERVEVIDYMARIHGDGFSILVADAAYVVLVGVPSDE